MLQYLIARGNLFWFALVFAISRQLAAEPMLLIELHTQGGCFDCLPTGMRYGFAVLQPGNPDRPPPAVTWELFATPDQVGQTFSVPADLLPVFDEFLTNGNTVGFNLYCCGSNGQALTSPPRLNHTDTSDIVTINRIAPNLGPNLFGYRITDITQTIDELEFTAITPSLFRGSGAIRSACTAYRFHP